jgi:hypothetical protein
MYKYRILGMFSVNFKPLILWILYLPTLDECPLGVTCKLVIPIPQESRNDFIRYFRVKSMPTNVVYQTAHLLRVKDELSHNKGRTITAS